MCAPVYRDAIAFYNYDKEIVSALNVCLSCDTMQLNNFVQINADFKTYELIRKFFVDIGHDVEKPIQET